MRRDVLDGKVWTAAPLRVLQDTADTLVLACWPGTEGLVPALFTSYLQTGDDSIRTQLISSMASRDWELARYAWRDTTLVIRNQCSDYFTVHRYFGTHRFRGTAHRPGGWYVNFELPSRRTAIGYDTFDLLLDLVVSPDLDSCTWKDEHEYAHARRLGVISDAVHARVAEAREQVLALIESRAGPFTEDWAIREPGPGWPVPVLPADALVLPATG